MAEHLQEVRPGAYTLSYSVFTSALWSYFLTVHRTKSNKVQHETLTLAFF